MKKYLKILLSVELTCALVGCGITKKAVKISTVKSWYPPEDDPWLVVYKKDTTQTLAKSFDIRYDLNSKIINLSDEYNNILSLTHPETFLLYQFDEEDLPRIPCILPSDQNALAHFSYFIADNGDDEQIQIQNNENKTILIKKQFDDKPFIKNKAIFDNKKQLVKFVSYDDFVKKDRYLVYKYNKKGFLTDYLRYGPELYNSKAANFKYDKYNRLKSGHIVLSDASGTNYKERLLKYSYEGNKIQKVHVKTEYGFTDDYQIIYNSHNLISKITKYVDSEKKEYIFKYKRLSEIEKSDSIVSDKKIDDKQFKGPYANPIALTAKDENTKCEKDESYDWSTLDQNSSSDSSEVDDNSSDTSKKTSDLSSDEVADLAMSAVKSEIDSEFGSSEYDADGATYSITSTTRNKTSEGETFDIEGTYTVRYSADNTIAETGDFTVDIDENGNATASLSGS